MAIPKMVEKIHFDPKHPENQTIKLQNKKEKVYKVYKDDRWKYEDKEETINDLLDRGYYVFDMKYPQLKKNLSNLEKTRYEDFQTKIDEQDKKLIKDMKQKIDIVFLNNR